MTGHDGASVTLVPGVLSPLPRPAGADPRFAWLAITRHGPDLGAAPPESAAHTALAARLARAAGLADAAWAVQVHGGEALAVARPGLAGAADALATDVPGLALLGRSADCPLVLVGGPAARGRSGLAWGMAHASWRSSVAGIVDRLLELLVARYELDPGRAAALVAPSAGPCCYAVGEEVRAAARRALGPAADRFFADRDGRLFWDLWATAADRLAAAGLSPARISVNGWCTICRSDLFHSHRAASGRAGRGGALVGAIRR